jgi:hypothetical protein
MLTPMAVTSGLSMGMVGAEIDATGKFTMSGVTLAHRISSLHRAGAQEAEAGAGVNWQVRSAIFRDGHRRRPARGQTGQNVDGVAVTFTDSLGSSRALCSTTRASRRRAT